MKKFIPVILIAVAAILPASAKNDKQNEKALKKFESEKKAAQAFTLTDFQKGMVKGRCLKETLYKIKDAHILSIKRSGGGWISASLYGGVTVYNFASYQENNPKGALITRYPDDVSKYADELDSLPVDEFYTLYATFDGSSNIYVLDTEDVSQENKFTFRYTEAMIELAGQLEGKSKKKSIQILNDFFNETSLSNVDKNITELGKPYYFRTQASYEGYNQATGQVSLQSNGTIKIMDFDHTYITSLPQERGKTASYYFIATKIQSGTGADVMKYFYLANESYIKGTVRGFSGEGAKTNLQLQEAQKKFASDKLLITPLRTDSLLIGASSKSSEVYYGLKLDYKLMYRILDAQIYDIQLTEDGDDWVSFRIIDKYTTYTKGKLTLFTVYPFSKFQQLYGKNSKTYIDERATGWPEDVGDIPDLPNRIYPANYVYDYNTRYPNGNTAIPMDIVFDADSRIYLVEVYGLASEEAVRTFREKQR